MATDSTRSVEGFPSFVGHLRALKRNGCNLLVVGDVPRHFFVRASASMFGDHDIGRYRAIAVTDADEESVRTRLRAVDDPEGTRTQVLSCTRSVRCSSTGQPASETTASETTPPVDSEPSPAELPTPRTVSDHSELRRALFDTIDAFDRHADGIRPAQLRVGVDSLGPLLHRTDERTVRQFVERVGERVSAHDGMAHFVLAEPYDSDHVQRLADAFDAVVELRVGDVEGQERWHLPDEDVTMPWVPL